MSSRDGWKPRHLPNGVYCSPLCGGQCTKAAHDAATEAAKATAVRMGAGWEPRVWENLGWHWLIGKGKPLDGSMHAFILEINPTMDGEYLAWFQGEKQFTARAKTPEDAIGFLLQDVRSFLQRIEDELRAAA